MELFHTPQRAGCKGFPIKSSFSTHNCKPSGKQYLFDDHILLNLQTGVKQSSVRLKSQASLSPFIWIQQLSYIVHAFPLKLYCNRTKNILLSDQSFFTNYFSPLFCSNGLPTRHEVKSHVERSNHKPQRGQKLLKVKKSDSSDKKTTKQTKTKEIYVYTL